MWVLIRIFTAIIAYFVRTKALIPNSSPKNKAMVDGIECRTFISKTRKGAVTTSTIEINSPSQVLFKLTSESKIDRFFKNLGLSSEFQVGEKAFDEKIYISADHPALLNLLEANSQIRKLITEFFERSCRSITANGNTLQFHFPGQTGLNPDLIKLAAAFQKQFAQINFQPTFFFKDSFARRATILEGLSWSVAGYGYGGVVTLYAAEITHFDSFQIMKTGLILGFLMFSVLLAAIIIFLSGSSRGHRVIIECGIVLLLGFPLSGIFLARDINTSFDKSPMEIIEPRVHSKEVVSTRSSGSPWRNDNYYYLHFDPIKLSTGISIPERIGVPFSFYERIREGQRVRISASSGYLKIPWYRSMNLIE